MNQPAGPMPSIARQQRLLNDEVGELALHLDAQRWASAEKSAKAVLSIASKIHQRLRLIIELEEDGALG